MARGAARAYAACGGVAVNAGRRRAGAVQRVQVVARRAVRDEGSAAAAQVAKGTCAAMGRCVCAVKAGGGQGGPCPCLFACAP